MGVNNKNLFFIIFLIVTVLFSWLAYKPDEVTIGGPFFPQMDYFIEELDEISRANNIKITYFPVSDIETYLIEGTENDIDLAIIPNPQGVVNLGERNIAIPINNVINEKDIKNKFSNHLIQITTSKKDNNNYGLWFRLIPNSLIWYDVEKYKSIGSPKFESYEDVVSFTKDFSSKEKPLWCLDIESGASTGWIATNWLEDLILHQKGPEIYDLWMNQDLLSGSDEITLSILDIGKLIFIEGAVFGGNERMIRKEFRNNYRNLVDEENPCVFSWSGHFASNYFPNDKDYSVDYDFFKFPSEKNKDAMVGIGDALIVLNSTRETKTVINALVDDNFGKKWMSKSDSTYISANKNSEISLLKNELTFKEAKLIKKAIEQDLFRYDASELMERRIGSDSLWHAMTKYIELTSKYIDEITEELDFSY
ncbi:MAG: hypothetical protein VYD43_00090 [Actinomycetota bacterium]|nr:hypothetical protein [Actinomycetota bacterium]